MYITGSSPLTRGTQLLKITENNTIRFIPAYAGNSLILSFELRRQMVHPRLRGELALLHYGNSWKAGSSPLTRGTPLFDNIQ